MRLNAATLILTLLLTSTLAGPFAHASQTPQVAPVPLDETVFAPFLTAQTFTCSRKTCGQMRSCAEACHALTVCGDTRRDGDNDGIPCENLCSRRC